MIGKRYGRLVVIEEYKTKVLAVCDCGKEKMVNKANVVYGGSRSCGCLKAEMLSKRRKIHGMTETKEYAAWCKMKSRCSVETDVSYQHYGGRGISVCKRWMESFENFYEDMGDRPKGRSIDRIDVNGDYEPGNCRWATRRQQQENKTNTVVITFNGRSTTLCEWSRETGIKYHTLYRRIFTMNEPLEIAFRPCGSPK